MPEVDVAAALAAVMHGEQPLLLEPEPEPRSRDFDTREQRPERDGGKKPERRPRGRAPTSRWRRTASRSASATRSSRARSSARWPTRAASRAGTSAHRHPPGLLPRRAAPRPPGRHPRPALRHPHLRQADRDPPDDGPLRAAVPARGPRWQRRGGYKGKNAPLQLGTPIGASPSRRRTLPDAPTECRPSRAHPDMQRCAGGPHVRVRDAGSDCADADWQADGGRDQAA